MHEPTDSNSAKESLREQIIGLGARSLRKSYYPQLQKQIDELNRAKAVLEEKSASLEQLLGALEVERQHAAEHARRFQALFEQISDGVAVVDAETFQFWRVNPAFCAMTGYQESELLELGIPALHPPEVLRNLTGELRAQKAGQQIFFDNVLFKRKDQSAIYVDLNTTGIVMEGRQFVIGVCRDVTERKRVADELRKAKDAAESASQAKSLFLANISHELRTPMHALIGTLDLLISSETCASSRTSLAQAKGQAQSLLGLLDAILSLSRVESGKARLREIAFSLEDCVQEHVAAFAKRATEKGVELSSRLSPGIPPILVGDPIQLGQVLVNLLDNALKFTSRGEILLEIEVERIHPGEALLRFTVSDTGIGVPASHLDKIFEPFQQVDNSSTRVYGGAGLGLAITRRLVEVFGGHIRVESEPGKGSRFSFTARFGLPSGPAPESQKAQSIQAN